MEGLTLMLKLQYFGHLIQIANSLEKTLMLGKIEGRRRRGQQRMRWLDGITDSVTWVWVNSGVGDGQGGLACCHPWVCKESHTTEWLNWMERISWRPWGLIWQGEMYVALGHVLKEPLSDPWKLTRRETGRLRCLPHCKQRARSQSKAAQDCGDAKTIRKVPSYPEKRRTRRCLNSSTSTSLVLWGQKPLVFLLRDLFIPDFVCLGKRRMTEKIT